MALAADQQPPVLAQLADLRCVSCIVAIVQLNHDLLKDFRIIAVLIGVLEYLGRRGLSRVEWKFDAVRTSVSIVVIGR